MYVNCATYSKRKLFGVLNEAFSLYCITLPDEKSSTCTIGGWATNYILWLTDDYPYKKSEQTGTLCTCFSARKLCTNTEAEFLDVIGTKVLRVLLLAIHSHFYSLPLWAKVVWNWIVMKILYTETSSLRTLKILPRNFNEIVRSWICGWDRSEWLERLTANAVVATVLGSIPASSDTMESGHNGIWGAADEAVLNIIHK